MVSDGLMVPPDPELSVLRLESWRDAEDGWKNRSESMRRHDSDSDWSLGIPPSPQKTRELCVGQWGHLGTDPEVAITLDPLDSAESQRTWLNRSWEALFLETERALQEGLWQPSLAAGL